MKMKSSILLLLLFLAFTCGQKCFELNETHSWSRGYTGLINIQADQLTTEWNLLLEFSDPPLSFKTWKGNTVLDGSTYNITNKCYNGVIYSSQCLSIDYIVRHGYKDPPTIDQVTFNGDILPSCTQPLVCEVVNSSEAAGCESCSKCPSPGVEGGYETYDHATEQFSQLWGNISNLNTPALNGSTSSALEANVTKLHEELAQIKDALTALQTPVLFNCVFMNGDVATSTTLLAPYNCDVNDGTAIDATTGVFTAPKAGKYRLTFQALSIPLEEKKVTCLLVKTSSGTETKIARSVAQIKKSDGATEESLLQITTTIDIIHGFQKGDTVQVAIEVKNGGKVVGGTAGGNTAPQVIFTGEFIRS